jgi:hypothetical protein
MGRPWHGSFNQILEQIRDVIHTIEKIFLLLTPPPMCHIFENNFITIIKINMIDEMSATNDSVAISHIPGDGITVPSTALGTHTVNTEGKVNLIESDDKSQHFITSNVEMELIPYPYVPSSEEMSDYYQLEQSLGEDWSLRLACELSLDEISIDDNDGESIYDSQPRLSNNDDYRDSRRPEDIEFRYNGFVNAIEVPSESISKCEILL